MALDRRQLQVLRGEQDFRRAAAAQTFRGEEGEKNRGSREGIAAGVQKGANTRATILANRPPKPEKPIPITTYDPQTGTNRQSYIMPAEARKIAEQQAQSMDAASDRSPEDSAVPGILKPPAAVLANRMASSRQSLSVGNEILRDLADPAVQEKLGPILGRYQSLSAAAGAGDPIATKLIGAIKGFSAMQMNIHGSRAFNMAKDVEQLLTIRQTPEALAAALDGILSASRALASEYGGPGGEPAPGKPARKRYNPATGKIE